MPMPDPLALPAHIWDTVKLDEQPAPPGETMRAMLARTPQAMSELMQQFIDNKDLNARAAIRLRMKALLDMVSVDTAYPPLFTERDARRAPQPMQEYPGQNAAGDLHVPPLGARLDPGDVDVAELRELRRVAPIPGADAAARQNAEIL